MASKPFVRVLVTIEAKYDTEDLTDITDNVKDALETLREQGEATATVVVRADTTFTL